MLKKLEVTFTAPEVDFEELIAIIESTYPDLTERQKTLIENFTTVLQEAIDDAQYESHEVDPDDDMPR